MSDSYKVTHWLQYPPKTQFVYSYFESRGGSFNEIVFFGLQYLIKRYLAGKVVTSEKIKEADFLFKEHFRTSNFFNKKDWEYILKKYKGRLPIIIKAVPEGTVVNPHNVLMTVENTDSRCFWLTNYLETLLSQVWYPTTIATQSREMKKIIKKHLEKTGDPTTLNFKLFDFGYRGGTSQESAAIGGAAHLVNFQASETIAAIRLLQKYYKAGMTSFAVPAAEHSTIISWGKESEAKAYENMLRIFPEGIVAIVSDSYNIFKACETIWGSKLKKMVQSRKGTIVIRPDSGDPSRVLPEVLNILGKKFGYSMNSKGYKLLPPYIRVFQGDAIEFSNLEYILKAIVSSSWSIDNIAFGSGGGLLQKVNRDTLKFAFKCSNVTINDKKKDVWKNPSTGPEKASKSGRLVLLKVGHKWQTFKENEVNTKRNRLKIVFKNGELIEEQFFKDIQKRSKV